jgi:hypothetical protein
MDGAIGAMRIVEHERSSFVADASFAACSDIILFAEFKIPTPSGPIKVLWSKGGNNVEYSVEYPKRLKAVVIQDASAKISEPSANGKKIMKQIMPTKG